MPPAKNKATDLPWDKDTTENKWTEYENDPDTQWIEYREPTTSQVDIPGQGMTTVQDHKLHRVPINEWPAYEKALNESKKGL